MADSRYRDGSGCGIIPCCREAGYIFHISEKRKMEEQIMKEYSKWKSGKRFLTAAITLSLLGSLGLYSPAAYAEEDFEEYTGSITGKEDNASEYVMAHITIYR